MILEGSLSDLVHGGPLQADIAEVISRLAVAAVAVREVVNDGALGAAISSGRRSTCNSTGDVQQELDLHADEVFMSAVQRSPVALYATEELEQPVLLNSGARLALAIDPLDGSSNIDTNVSIGTIFSILPVIEGEGGPDADATFAQPGTRQLAAGYFIYGPQLALAVTWGDGVRLFIYSARMDAFVLAHEGVRIPPKCSEFAINSSNYRHWEQPVKMYVDDCLKGNAGPREKDYNMRWIASLVAECYRVMRRGGVFLYPGDARPGYSKGRLRLTYEANPIAMLIEQAGGRATDGEQRILDLLPQTLHQRTPLIFGSLDEVERIGRYYADPGAIGERAPLFGTRGLFRA